MQNREIRIHKPSFLSNFLWSSYQLLVGNPYVSVIETLTQIGHTHIIILSTYKWQLHAKCNINSPDKIFSIDRFPYNILEIYIWKDRC